MFIAQDSPRPDLLSRRTACETCNISLSTLKLLIGRGEIRQIRIGRRSLIPRMEIERFIADRLGLGNPT